MDMLFPEPATFNFPTRTLQEVVQDNALELCSLLLTICVSHLQTLGNLLGNEGCKIWVVCCASFGELALYADVLVTTTTPHVERANVKSMPQQSKGLAMRRSKGTRVNVCLRKSNLLKINPN